MLNCGGHAASMAKSRTKRKRSRRQVPRTSQKTSLKSEDHERTHLRFHKLWHSSKTAFSIAIAVLGVLSAVVTLVPDVSISAPTYPQNSDDFLAASFDVSNAGYWPLEDVNVSIGIAEMKMPGTHPITVKKHPNDNGTPNFDLLFTPPDWQHRKLDGHERMTIRPRPLIYGRTVESADIAITVSFRPMFAPWHRRSRLRFVAKPDSDGMIYWRAWPFDAMPPAL